MIIGLDKFLDVQHLAGSDDQVGLFEGFAHSTFCDGFLALKSPSGLHPEIKLASFHVVNEQQFFILHDNRTSTDTATHIENSNTHQKSGKNNIKNSTSSSQLMRSRPSAN